MTQVGKRKSSVEQTDLSRKALHLFALARVHELHLLAERCAGPLAKAAAPPASSAWWRKLLRETP
ncbi:MAG: hypothetical protein H7Y62_05175 [Hyphomicrobium sp.]|nr:hypothetical protein [Hyphomicrobium sp.]